MREKPTEVVNVIFINKDNKHVSYKDPEVKEEYDDISEILIGLLNSKIRPQINTKIKGRIDNKIYQICDIIYSIDGPDFENDDRTIVYYVKLIV